MSPPNNGSSISFLDLLTCGLGGILLLFFIVVAMRQQLDVEGRENAQGHSVDEQSIVMIHLETSDGEPLFNPGGGSWVLKKNDQDVLAPESVEMSIGSSFAVFYTVQPLPPGTTLRLAGVRDDAKLESIVTDRFGSQEYDQAHVNQSGFIYSW